MKIKNENKKPIDKCELIIDKLSVNNNIRLLHIKYIKYLIYE